jgi:hypothetical protein
MKIYAIAAALALTLSGCATAPKDFYADPTKPKDTALCRAALETSDPVFQRDAAAELARRGLTAEECQNRVAMETAAIVGIAAVATGVAVVAACQNGCAAPSYTPTYSGPDYDCAGGRGNGPLFVYQPTPVGWNDPYDLDADNDGIGCEATDIARGS